MSKINLKQLRELAERATPGPWAYEATGMQSNEWHLGVVLDDNEEELSGRIEEGTGEVVELVCSNEQASGFEDAEFISAANPATVLKFLDYIQLANEALERIRDNCHGPYIKAPEYADSILAQYKKEFE